MISPEHQSNILCIAQASEPAIENLLRSVAERPAELRRTLDILGSAAVLMIGGCLQQPEMRLEGPRRGLWLLALVCRIREAIR